MAEANWTMSSFSLAVPKGVEPCRLWRLTLVCKPIQL
jgi:hypothetical protein